MVKNDRTEQKLKYAEITLSELENYQNKYKNDDWERAHQENFFYHLVGSIESILLKINEGYSLQMELSKITWGSIGGKLTEKGIVSPAFTYLSDSKEKIPWMKLLYAWRNHGTHRGNVGKYVNLSTNQELDNNFKDPKTGKEPMMFENMGCFEVMNLLYKNVVEVINYSKNIDRNINF